VAKGTSQAETAGTDDGLNVTVKRTYQVDGGRAVSVDLGNDLWIETVEIGSLKEQDVNAHVMVPDMLARLTENIRQRGGMESLAYCAQPGGSGQVEIVSGHHRIRAARAAGMAKIPVIVDKSNLTRSQIVAKQLAHNALVGVDDAGLIKQLLTQITSVDDLLATGLQQNMLPTPDKFKVTLFTPHADYKWKTMAFVFLSHQVDQIEALVKSLKSQTDVICLACQDQFEPFINAVATFARKRNVISAPTAISLLTETALAEVAKLEAQEAGETPPPADWVPLTTLIGATHVPPDAAAVIQAAVDRMRSAGDTTEQAPWLCVERWAADYLAGQ
jgi:hypothetical protein